MQLLDGTGLRISEALALEWADVDLGRRKLHVQRRLYEGHIGPPKSRYGKRGVPLPSSLARELWAAQAASTSALVFPDRDGGHADARNVRRRVWDKAAVAAGVPEAGFHDLRHTYGSRLFAAGWNMLAISRMLGHHSASFTLRTYVSCLSDDLPDVDVIDRATGHRLDTVAPDKTRHDDAQIEPDSAPLRAISV